MPFRLIWPGFAMDVNIYIGGEELTVVEMADGVSTWGWSNTHNLASDTSAAFNDDTKNTYKINIDSYWNNIKNL